MAHLENFYTKILVPDIAVDTAGLDEMLASAGIVERQLEAYLAKTSADGSQAGTNPYAIPAGSEVEGQASTRAKRGHRQTTYSSLDKLNEGAVPDTQVTLDPAEAKMQGRDGSAATPDSMLRWKEGARIWILNERNKWVAKMRELSIPLAAGPSGTTNKLMNMGTLLGTDKYQTRLACMGYLMPPRHHSLVEIMVAAAAHGCTDYIPGQEMYTSIEPFATEELKAIGGGKFPHEPPATPGGGT